MACLSANPHLVRIAAVAMLRETDAAWVRRLPKLLPRLEAMKDFYMEINWVFRSWVPLVSKVLPTDSVRSECGGENASSKLSHTHTRDPTAAHMENWLQHSHGLHTPRVRGTLLEAWQVRLLPHLHPPAHAHMHSRPLCVCTQPAD